MKSHAIHSSVVRNADYEESLRQLDIEFIGGSIYRYYDVDETLFDAFIGSPSKGEFLNMSIKPNHRYVRLGTRRGKLNKTRLETRH
jgi:hypothetical protein